MGEGPSPHALKYVLLHEDHRIEIPAVVEHTLVEILSRQERALLRSGRLVAVDEQSGALFSEDSPLYPGSVIRLRPPQPVLDLQDIGVPINRAGELVSVHEATEIKLVELQGEQLFEDKSLSEIRAIVREYKRRSVGVPEAPSDPLPWNIPVATTVRSEHARFTVLNRLGKMPKVEEFKHKLGCSPNVLFPCAA